VTPARLRWALAALVTSISVVVVVSAANPVPHSGGDNAGYVALAHALVTGAGYVDAFDPQGLPHTKYPPVFPGLLALLISLGARTWVALKLSAAVPTVLAVAFTCLWAQRIVGVWSGFAVALLLALSSGIVYYSQWVLSDPLFLAFTMASLWALAMADRSLDDAGGASENSQAPTEGPPPTDRARGSNVDGGSKESPAPLRAGWLTVGVVMAGLAYFTRSAGLPLVVALLAWLVFHRRWRSTAAAGTGLLLPMLAWWLRGRGEGVAQYGTEFWMVNPYQPALGTIGVPGLVPRVIENMSSYVLQHGPAGVVGAGGPELAALGVVLTLVAVTGWVLSIRERVGPAELFFPLYAGLILVWPTVWGGDRFALPLYPLVFLYGAVVVRFAAGRLPVLAGNAIAAVAVLGLLLPATGNWLDGNRQTRECAAFAEQRGPWACYGARVGYFVMAASWVDGGLPEGAAVLSRKPRHFYALSGHPSRAFPFEENVEAHLALADELGARYVLLDRWDGQATRYVGAAVRQKPGAFCYVRGFGQPNEGGAQLLGILPPDLRDAAGAAGETSAGLSRCPDSYVRPGTVSENYSPSGRIPLLEGLGS